jgi:amino acid adenylation domain-containing protein
MQEEIVQGIQLSPQQRHLWLLQQSGGNQPFRVTGSIHIEGPLDKSVLAAALESVIIRHEILRTVFPSLPDRSLPLQYVTDIRPLIEEYDLRHLPQSEQAVQLERFFGEMNCLPFDFARGPLLYLKLFDLSPDNYQLIVALPALCADTATLRNLLLGLGRSYSAYLNSHVSSEETLQYTDLSQWLNEMLESEEAEIGKQYWRQHQERVGSSLPLSFGKGAAANSAFDSKCFGTKIDLEITHKLNRLVEERASSLPVFFLTCWQILLWRLTGESEIATGTAFDGRRYEELKEAFGPLTKFLPVHCHLDENLLFSEVLNQAVEAIYEAQRWQEAFTWQQASTSETNGSGEPFPALSFEFEKEPESFVAGSVRFSLDRYESCIEQFKIKLSCVEGAGPLKLNFHYDAGTYCPSDMKRLVEEFHTLLESILRQPESLIGELEIIGEQERREILFEFNQTEADFSQDKCVHELFEEQAARTPNALAVIFEEERLSYHELNVRANQLARYLCALGVGPEAKVALYVERSPEMLVGILGILKAGGSYLPLDPHYPPQRISFMLTDVAVDVLLTQQRLLKMLPPHTAKVVCLDSDWTCIAQQREDNLPTQACADNLVYVIYTSGSTGQPKGSMIQHRSLVNHALNMVKVYELKPGSRMMQFFSLSFDASAEDFFPTLLSGATLVCHPDPFAYTVLQFLAFCEQHHITTLHLPVVYWHEVVDRLASDGLTLPACVEVLSVGGESPSAAKLQTWAGCTGRRVKFRNVYGPTETTVTSAVYETVDEIDTTHGGARVPIGRPINNTQLYLLDRHLRPVPLGVPGELYIGGLGLARGYLNRPDSTAEKFIPNPFSSVPGARLYKTGDQARYLLDGKIVFLGRGDQQVKIRGYRIELGEIEITLARHPQVREAVIVAREDRPGDSRLAAYVLSIPERTVTGSELRDYLAEGLPEYMIPSVIMFVKEWPLTPNGKVDRRALSPPAQMLRAEEYVAPRTSVEEVLASIWAEVLGVERVGVNDNFFELGGHSLLTTQMIAQVRESLQVELLVRSLFEAPTVAELAAVLLEVSNEHERTMETADLLLKLAQLSDDEVEAMLDQRKPSSKL